MQSASETRHAPLKALRFREARLRPRGRARQYDPETGRWLQRDPLLFKGKSLNLYSYSLNDPINNVDADGNLTQTYIAANYTPTQQFGFGILELIAAGASGGGAGVLLVTGATPITLPNAIAGALLAAGALGLVADGIENIVSALGRMTTQEAVAALNSITDQNIKNQVISNLPPSLLSTLQNAGGGC